jgi:hypothetical protein
VAMLGAAIPSILWVGRKTGSYPPGRGAIGWKSSKGSNRKPP